MSGPDPDARPEPRSFQTRYDGPRPAFTIIQIDAPSRRRAERIVLTHMVRVEDYDPEHQNPLTYGLAAMEDPAIRATLRELAEDPYRSCDWWATVWTDGTYLFDGPARDALDDVEHAGEKADRARATR